MTSLLSLVVTLRPTARATVPVALGPACQAWFLDLLGTADPPLAERLHAGSRRRPYTVSSLQGTGPVRRGRAALKPDGTLWVRFTSLEARLSAVLLEGVVARLPATVTLGGAELAVERATTDASTHPWAGQDNYEALLERHLLGGAKPRRRVGLHFASPTTFRRTGGTFEGKQVRDHDQSLPLPSLVFGSLADAWEAFGPVKLARDVRGFAASCLAVRGFRLESHLVEDGRSRQAGMVGTCEYQALSGDSLWLRLLHLLAAFSFFCGVGRGTTAGWGQARKLRDRDRGKR
jgi:CRISPR-associated endoribonuclease Cas6